MSDHFDAEQVIQSIERAESYYQPVTWENAVAVADRMIERIENLEQSLPTAQRLALREALEERASKLELDIEYGEVLQDALGTELSRRVVSRPNPELSERDKEIAKLREIGEALHGASVRMAFAERDQQHSGRVIGVTDKHAVLERLDKPGHLVVQEVSVIREAARQAIDLPNQYESNGEALTLYRDVLVAAQKDAAFQRLAGKHEATGPTVQAFEAQIEKASVAIQAVGLSLDHQKSAGRTEIGMGK